jgi:hypothetical protein
MPHAGFELQPDELIVISGLDLGGVPGFLIFASSVGLLR